MVIEIPDLPDAELHCKIYGDGVFVTRGNYIPISSQGVVIEFPASNLKIHFVSCDAARRFAETLFDGIGDVAMTAKCPPVNSPGASKA